MPTNLSYAVGGISGLMEGQQVDLAEADRLAIALSSRVAAASTVLTRILRNPFMKERMERVRNSHLQRSVQTPLRPDVATPIPTHPTDEDFAIMLLKGEFEGTEEDFPASSDADDEHDPPFTHAYEPHRETQPPSWVGTVPSPLRSTTVATDFSTEASDVANTDDIEETHAPPFEIEIPSQRSPKSIPSVSPRDIVSSTHSLRPSHSPIKWTKGGVNNPISVSVQVNHGNIKQSTTEVTFADEFEEHATAEEWVGAEVEVAPPTVQSEEAASSPKGSSPSASPRRRVLASLAGVTSTIDIDPPSPSPPQDADLGRTPSPPPFALQKLSEGGLGISTEQIESPRSVSSPTEHEGTANSNLKSHLLLGLSAKTVFSEVTTDDGLTVPQRSEYDMRGRKRSSVHFESPATPSTPASPGIFQSPGGRSRRNSIKPARFGSVGSEVGDSGIPIPLSARGSGGVGFTSQLQTRPRHSPRDSMPSELMMALASFASSGSISGSNSDAKKRAAKLLTKIERRETDYRAVIAAEESLNGATKIRPIAKELRLLLAENVRRSNLLSEEDKRRKLRKLEEGRGRAQTRLLEETLLHRQRLIKEEGKDRDMILQNHASLVKYAKEVKYSVREKGAGGFSDNDGETAFALPKRTKRRIGCLSAEGRKLIDVHHSSGGGSSVKTSPALMPLQPSPSGIPSQFTIADSTARSALSYEVSASDGGGADDPLSKSTTLEAPELTVTTTMGSAAHLPHSVDRFYWTPSIDLSALISEKLTSKEWKKKKDKARDPPKTFYVNRESKERVWDLEKAVVAKEQAVYRESVSAGHIHPAYCERCDLHFAGIPSRWRCGKCGDDLAQSPDRKAVASRYCSACKKDLSRSNPQSSTVCRVCGKVTCRPCGATTMPLPGLGYSGKTLLPVCTVCLAA